MESVKFAAPVDTAEEWKKKKNYKPAALFTVLLLGTAFLAGKSYAAYGSNASVPTGSLSAKNYWGRSYTMASGPLPDNNCKGNQHVPKKCAKPAEFWSVVGFQDDKGCVGEQSATTICGQICVNGDFDTLLHMIQKYAPNPKPVPGNCASHGYSHDTFKSFDLFSSVADYVPLLNSGYKHPTAEIFTKEKL